MNESRKLESLPSTSSLFTLYPCLICVSSVAGQVAEADRRRTGCDVPFRIEASARLPAQAAAGFGLIVEEHQPLVERLVATLGPMEL